MADTTTSGRFCYTFGAFRLDPAEKVVLQEDNPVPLTPKAVETLLALVERHGHLVTKEELIGILWPDTFVEENNLAQNISMLRRALGDTTGAHAPFIETVPRRGYRFIGPVEKRVAADAVRRPTHSTGRPVRAATIWTAIAGAIVVLAIVASSRVTERRAGDVRRGEVRLAILPFDNLTGDPDQAFFCDGLTEEMIGKLGSLNPERLSVIARGSVMRYKSKAEPLDAIGRDLGVGYIVQGSVRRGGGRVRISAELTDLSRGTVIWTRSYDRDLQDVLALQGDVAREVAHEVGVELVGGSAAITREGRRVSIEAYEAYLRGRYFWNQRTAGGLRKALEHFHKAVELDPNYAAAYAALAHTYPPLGYFGYMHPAEARAGMRQAVERALALDRDLADVHLAHASLLSIYEWRLADAEAAFRRAIALNSVDATAHHWYAQLLVAMGRYDEGLAESRRAIELDPLSLSINGGLGNRLYWARRFDEAIAQCEKTLELEPTYPEARTCLGLAYTQRGAHDEAVRALERNGPRLEQASLALAYLGYAYARAGRPSDARAVIAELANRAESGDYVSPYAPAVVHAGLGENDSSLKWLERAYDEGSPRMVYLNVEPIFDGLRTHPKFKRLLEQVGLHRPDAH